MGHSRLLFLLAIWSASAVLSAAEFGDVLEIPLEQGRFYSVRELHEQYRKTQASSAPQEPVPDRRVELTGIDRAALQLAHEAGLLRVQFTEDRLLIALPDYEDDGVRRRARRRLERIFGIPLSDWPSDKGLRLPDNFDPNRRSVLLVHGLESGPEAMQRLRAACEATGVQVLVFDYPNDGPVSWSGEHLAVQLRRLSSLYPEFQVAIIAHSLGGLVARAALEDPVRPIACVTDLVTLGTPHHGSRLAGMQDWLQLVFESIPAKLRPSVTLSSGLGEAAVDLLPGSRFLTELNSRDRAAGVRYHIAKGSKGFLTEDQAVELRAEVDAICRRRNLSNADRDRMLQFLEADELQSGRGDGAVTLTSAHLAGATTERVFERNHLEWLSLPGEKPEKSDVFLWIIQVLNWPESPTEVPQ